VFADVLCGLKGKLLWYWLYFVFGVNYRDDVGSNVTISGDGDASRTSAFFQVPQSTQPDHELQYRMGLVARSGMISSATTSVTAAHAAAARGFRELANIRESRISSAAAALVGQYEESSNKKTKLEARGAAGNVTSSAMQQEFAAASGLDPAVHQAGSAAAADDQTFVNPESAEQQVRHASNSSTGTAAAAAPWLQYSAHLQSHHHPQQAYSSSQYPTAYFSQVTTTTTKNTITSSSTSSAPSQLIKCQFLGYSFDCNLQVYISKLFLLAGYLQVHLLLQIVTRS
jgi:hypothetical protein